MDEDSIDEIVRLPTRVTPFDGAALAAALNKKVIGQDKIADHLIAQLKRRLAVYDLSRGTRERPIGVFCFAGPPGTGKTLFAKVLAENMYGGKGRLLHLEMSQYSQPHTKTVLLGSPVGYVGGPGQLTSELERNPKLIALLDGFEKACTEIHKIFLSGWNDGFLTDARTLKKISTTQAIFIATTNCAWERMLEIEKSMKDDPAGRDRAVNETLIQNGFAPEVLSRIDHTFIFQPLDRDGLARAAELKIAELAEKYSLKVAEIDPHYLFDLVVQERFQHNGIRELARAVEEQVGEMLLTAKVGGATTVRIAHVDGKPVIEALTNPPGAT